MSRRALFPPVFAPETSHPLVDDFSLRAARYQQRQQPSLPLSGSLPVRVNPMWSGNNELGREAAFAPDTTNRQMVLKMGEWGPPSIWTIALGLNYDTAQTPDAAFAVAAEVQFGTGGVVQTVELDWQQGAAITVPGNSIVVNAAYPFNGVPGFVIPPDLVLRASLAQFNPTNVQPTRSYRLLHPATTPITICPIPPFAKDVFVAPTNAIGAVDAFNFATNAVISFQYGSDDSPATLAAQSMSATQAVGWLDFTNQLVGPTVPLPVPEGARSLAVIWTAAGVPANPPAPFTWRSQFRIGL